jgi:hypothetical protein
MADHKYVELVIDWLESEWDETNYPGPHTGGTPTIIDADDAESQDFEGRKVHFDLSRNNAIEVSSSPNRTNEMIGTNPDYRFEDGVSIQIHAAHSDAVDFGHGVGVEGSAEFRALYQEVRRILHNHVEAPDRGGTQDAHTLAIFDESNLSGNYNDLYTYDITATIRGYEGLD